MSEKTQVKTVTELYTDFLTRTRLFYDLMRVKPGEVYADCILSEDILRLIFKRNEALRRHLYEVLVEQGVAKHRLNRAVFRIAKRHEFMFEQNVEGV